MQNVTTEQEGRVAIVTGELSGTDTWTSDYSLVIAGFNNESQFAVISKNIQSGDGELSIRLAGIVDEVTSVELCVINKIRKRVVSFATYEPSADDDTLRIDVGQIDVSMFAGIQTGIFNTTCTQCHGGSNYAAAGLYLTDGQSYNALVGIASQTIDSTYIVQPGDADNSLIYNLLVNTENTAAPYSYHINMVTENVRQQLMKDWINNLQIAETQEETPADTNTEEIQVDTDGI